MGAVIGGNTVEEAEAIIAPWSEYVEVPEYVVQTCDEFLEERRECDRLEVERHLKAKQAAERLAMTALKAYADYTGKRSTGTVTSSPPAMRKAATTGTSSADVGTTR